MRQLTAGSESTQPHAWHNVAHDPAGRLGSPVGQASGQQDVVIGTPVANRSRIEIENLIGFFVNTLALRLDVSGSPTVS